MTMSRGAVVVNPDETHGGAGLALMLYETDIASLVGPFALPALPTLGDTNAPFNPVVPCLQKHVDQVKAARMSILQDAARRANAYAVVILYIQGNAEIDVLVPKFGASDGLQRQPATFTAFQDLIGPGTDKHLVGTIA